MNSVKTSTKSTKVSNTNPLNSLVESSNLIDVTSLVVKKETTSLVVAKNDLKIALCEVRSFSSYFKELRKNHTKVSTLVREYSRKGSVIDLDVVHSVINLGNSKPILMEVEKYELKTGKPLTSWSESRIITFFLAAIIVPKVKK
jgi:hypothetical protein